ncbi:hypothetical protein EJ05DRAFT_513359 [Pseudovirgaria hyperparasitica]|uniref:HIG1 domain-containing protein n=1 Tax=Pseudovirgaria hyperparasitica TaxID=470096 RepID=A0A6A6VYU2_9PEZI|nr:uncharacterized protein EJ05DRAFT_513359 [Pseudovirgaria hyperparasitica]KAF2755039.1 hypothetical protein EJ05DRAFT_513359 [Pseudovirgaria hyperparasitica]
MDPPNAPPSDAPMPSSFDGDVEFYEESVWGMLKRRCMEEPLVPLGCGLTCAALLGATKSIRSGDHARANVMFRRRIYAQGFTLLSILVGSVYWQKDREKRKEYDGLVQMRKRQEKRDAWVQELERRDEDGREVKARMMKRVEMERVRDEKTRKALGMAATGDEEKGAVQKVEEGAKGVVEKVEDTAKKAFGKGGDSKSVLEDSEDRGILAAVRDLGWRR